MSKFPDLGSHFTGWTAAKIDGVWCVGQRGNLDTAHDATLRITGGFLDSDEAEEVAKWIVDQYNTKLIKHLAFRAGVHTEQMEKAFGHLA